MQLAMPARQRHPVRIVRVKRHTSLIRTTRTGTPRRCAATNGSSRWNMSCSPATVAPAISGLPGWHVCCRHLSALSLGGRNV